MTGKPENNHLAEPISRGEAIQLVTTVAGALQQMEAAVTAVRVGQGAAAASRLETARTSIGALLHQLRDALDPPAHG